MLAKVVADNHRDWHEWLPQISFSYNASVQESTRFTPYFLMHGSEPRWDVDFKLGVEDRTPYSVNDYADVLMRRLEGAHFLTREHLRITASRMSDWYDRKVKVQEFSPGDEVYVLNLKLYQGRCHKWLRRYSDVATVVRRINTVTYVVRGNWRTREKIVHVDKLKLKTKASSAADELDSQLSGQPSGRVGPSQAKPVGPSSSGPPAVGPSLQTPSDQVVVA